jgi:hypothetical protein
MMSASAIRFMQLPKFQKCAACNTWAWCDAEDVFTMGYRCRECVDKSTQSNDPALRMFAQEYSATKGDRLFIPY